MPKTCVSANPERLPALSRRNLLVGAATVAAGALGVPPALPANAPLAGMIEPDAALRTLEGEFEQALVTFWAAHRHYGQCEKRFFALRKGARTAAQTKRIRRETDVVVAERAADAAVHALHDLMLRLLHTPARSLADLAVKARVVKVWGQPEWWSAEDEDDVVAERLAAQVLDAVIGLASDNPEVRMFRSCAC